MSMAGPPLRHLRGVSAPWAIFLVATGTAAVTEAATSSPAAEVCFPAAPADGPGEPDPFRLPSPEAARRNLEGKADYRKGWWAAAREKYRAAEALDPDFLAPALNVACSFVRQERYDDAAAEVSRIVRRAYLPWRDEIEAAADLGALKVRPQWAAIEAAFEESRARWARDLDHSVLFIARTHQALGLGDGASGVFLLGPRQEIFAWSPVTLRTRQVTNEEGRVVVMLPARAGGRVAYVVAQKLVREAGRAIALRGVTAVVLDLGSLRVLGRRVVDGDIRELDLSEAGGGEGAFIFHVKVAAREPFELAFFHAAWTAGSAPPSSARRFQIALVPSGVAPFPAARRIPVGAPCPLHVRDRAAKDGTRQVEVQGGQPRTARPPRLLGGPFGAGLFGLPLP